MTATRVLARSLLPVGLLVVLTLSPEPMRADAPLSAKELAQLVGTEWYRVTVMGRPNGYARIETALVPTEGGKRLCVTEELRILVKVAGRDLQASKSQVTVYDERLRPARIELAKDELGRSSHLTATLDGDVLIVRSGPDGPGSPEPVEKRIQVPADLASDLLIQMRLLRGEIAVGDRFEYAVYDPEIVAAFDRIMRRRIADGEANGDGHGVDQGLDIDEIINGAFNGASLLEIEPGRSASPGPPETEDE